MIRAERVRMINERGEVEGIFSLHDALRIAKGRGLDLVELRQDPGVSVCKMVDYGKMRYQEQKKKSKNKKAQQIVNVKEIQLRPTIQEHDYRVKISHAVKFLEKGDNVKVSMQFRGREIAHQDVWKKLLDNVVRDLSVVGKQEGAAKQESKRVLLIFSPIKQVHSASLSAGSLDSSASFGHASGKVADGGTFAGGSDERCGEDSVESDSSADDLG
ncbi:hypothetical protein HYD_3650 [Candidatus Hydrogenosomobacter endosymbioticus]|uniref:Translation initiation factor IF-3 n=2 Tax=Candidatus Hydrogenosomobacter endosymbioticus TaxID=2558174 RepID=A0ABM7V8V8_9PROT|nr:hypothetical protein HYD_3650 [Candidatus Hydrogenosomobacter endosymbioticus]